MGCYLVVIGNIHNDEHLVYIFTGKVQDGTPSIFNKSHYNCWYKELRNHFYNKSCLWQFTKNVHVNCNLQIIYS